VIHFTVQPSDRDSRDFLHCLVIIKLMTTDQQFGTRIATVQ